MSTSESKPVRVYLIRCLPNPLLYVFVGVFFVLLLWPAFPLGVPEEWTWSRHRFPQSVGEFLDRFLPPAICGMFWLFVLRWFSHRRRRSRLVEYLSIPLLGVFGFSWGLAVQQAAPSPHKELKQLWVNYDRSASGYFFEAIFHTRRTSEFLQSYEARMKEGDVLHFGTHPPGLILKSRVSRNLMRQLPELIPLVMSTQSSDVVASFREIEIRVAAARPLDDFELAALVLVTLVSQICLGLTPIAVYLLARLVFGSEIGWASACLSATAPALAVFCPKSDVLYAFTSTIFLWLTLGAWLRPSWTGRIVSAVFSGIWLWVCLMLSLAHLPVVVAAAVFVMIFFWRSRSSSSSSSVSPTAMSLDHCGDNLRFLTRKLLTSILIQGCLFLIAVEVWNTTSGCNLWNVWPQNLRNHAGFYGQAVRTWYYWLPANLGELCLACGLPVLLSAACTWASFGFRGIRGQDEVQRVPGDSFNAAAGQAFVMATMTTWALLWLSGKNMGEAMRLWNFLTPWFAIAAAISIPPATQERIRVGFRSARRSEPLIQLLFLQLLVATLIVATVNGFSF